VHEGRLLVSRLVDANRDLLMAKLGGLPEEGQVEAAVRAQTGHPSLADLYFHVGGGCSALLAHPHSTP
jgi:hypothetical protein